MAVLPEPEAHTEFSPIANMRLDDLRAKVSYGLSQYRRSLQSFNDRADWQAHARVFE